MTDHDAMRLAMAQAHDAASEGEVPVGAVVLSQGRVIGLGQNRVIRDCDPTAHAEVVAMRLAGVALNNYRLTGCELFVTLEPCAMCAGAIVHGRIGRLIYAAADPKAGACGSVLNVIQHPGLNHRVQLEAGLLGKECCSMLQDFFRQRRALASRPAST